MGWKWIFFCTIAASPQLIYADCIDWIIELHRNWTGYYVEHPRQHFVTEPFTGSPRLIAEVRTRIETSPLVNFLGLSNASTLLNPGEDFPLGPEEAFNRYQYPVRVFIGESIVASEIQQVHPIIVSLTGELLEIQTISVP